ncbi:amidase [Streptomyces ehimensis]|uniref:Amidase n=1 Tax=Streptomyces ehimensis TaxID=68195 RepID=A0ABV9BWC4_9ACTN
MLAQATYTEMTACQAAAAVQAGTLSARNLVEAALTRIVHHDQDVRAFTDLWPEQARKRAASVDAALSDGVHLPLAGVPIGVKASEGITSLQSRRLIEAGCIPVGATSVPRRGTGYQTYGHTDRGPTLNPLNSRWSPGGSSAGSAAAVAVRLVPLATGSDGAGSVRIPAAWCGITGYKPTNGLLPARDRAGLNTPGPLVRTAADAIIYLQALTTEHPSAPTALSPLTVTWSPTLGFADTAPAVRETARAALERYITAGLLHRVDVPVQLRDPAPAWTALRQTAALTALEPATAELVVGNERTLAEVFQHADVIATPTTPHPPHGHNGPGDRMNVSLTWGFNITGHPAVSVPAGTTAHGEPVGLHLVARHGADHLLLSLAAAAEERAPLL